MANIRISGTILARADCAPPPGPPGGAAIANAVPTIVCYLRSIIGCRDQAVANNVTLPVERRFPVPLTVKLPSERGEPVRGDGVPHPGHQVQVVLEVMPRIEPGRQDLAGLVQVAQISPAVVPADIAGALRID